MTYADNAQQSRWSVTELELLKQNYYNLTVSELAALIHRSEGAVYIKANQLGLRKSVTWTIKELELLKERYASATTDELKSLFQHPVDSVIKKAEQFGLKRENVKRPVWRESEITLLRSLTTQEMSDQEIAIELNRSINSVEKQRRRLGILVRDKWSNEENSLLKQYYEVTKIAENLSLMLPGRSLNAICKQAIKLGLGKPEVWPNQMEQLLKQKYATSIMSELLAIFPGKTKRQLKRRAKQLGLKKDLVTLARCFHTIPDRMPKLPCSRTRWRNAILRRDGFRCQECGIVKVKLLLEAHHIIPIRDTNCVKYDMGNGICLCANCHNSIQGREYELKNKYQLIVASHKEKP